MGGTQSTRKITLVDDDKAGVIKLSESLAHRLRGQLEGQRVAAAATQKASSADTQEPLHPSPPEAPLPPPPVPEAPLLPPPPPPQTPLPPPPFIEKPLPIAPEPPKIPNVVPVEEPSKDTEPVKVPDVVPSPVVVPEPVVVEPPSEVTSEPLPPSVALPKASADPVPGKEAIADAPTDLPGAPDVGIAVKAGPSPTLAQPAGSIPPWSIYAEEAHLMVMRLREEKEQEIKKLNQEWKDKMATRENEFVNMAHLSEEQVSSALKEVESLFMKASCSPVCQNQQDAVMNCYQDHPHQSLRCNREVEQFTQCVDLSRLQSIMKQEVN